MKNKTLWLRITYIWGFIADLVMSVAFLNPKLFNAVSGMTIPPDDGLRFGLLVAFPVMLGWTLLLLWAVFKPLERRWVLLPLISVLISYILIEIFAISWGASTIQKMLPIFIMQVILIGLCIFSYINSRK